MLIGQVDPKTVSQGWHVPAQLSEVDSALMSALEEPSMDSALARMAPADSDYGILKDAYARYRRIATGEEWPRVTSGSGRVASLRARLAAEGYPADSITASLKAFQSRHGLAADGVLNAATIAALNVPASERVRQIALNLERYRWLPRSLGSRYVYVNVPSYRLDAYDSGRKVLTMKVVVGSEYEGKSTPVFSDTMETVVFRPYWNITPDIQAKEIAPKVDEDPGYLDRNDMEYYRDGGQTRIRQRTGDKNSLGLVKFLFPNSFNIYLHDTPAKALFAQTDRAASHGCIRLEHPDQLAQFVLGWSMDRVQAAMHSGPDNRSVRVPGTLPVYIVYFTAYAREGQVYFADDVYGRDDALEHKMPTNTDGPGRGTSGRAGG
jgi:murein L,D-transpeptidase YcbB/YkuD